jgi:hypothetical protein
MVWDGPTRRTELPARRSRTATRQQVVGDVRKEYSNPHQAQGISLDSGASPCATRANAEKALVDKAEGTLVNKKAGQMACFRLEL